MPHPSRVLQSVALVAVAVFVGAGLLLLAKRGPDSAGDDLIGSATDAAIAAVHGGRVTEVERTTLDGATWEVDVIAPDGTALDVRLDAGFAPVAIEPEADEDSER